MGIFFIVYIKEESYVWYQNASQVLHHLCNCWKLSLGITLPGKSSCYSQLHPDILGHLMTWVSKQQFLLFYWSKCGFLTPSSRNDVIVDSSEVGRTVSLCSHSWWEGRQGRHQAFGGMAQGTDQTMVQFHYHCFHELCSFSIVTWEQAPRHVISGCRYHFWKPRWKQQISPRKGHTHTCKDWGDEKTVWTDCSCCGFPCVRKLLPSPWLAMLSLHALQSASAPGLHTALPKLLVIYPYHTRKTFPVKEHLR